ncbi:UNVERIFIED_CONTAM: putative ribonuclease H protein [Sesamum indicum]
MLVIIEPKVKLDEQYFCRRLGFDKVISNSNSKIWCFMKEDLDCEILISQEQFLHLRIFSDFWPNGILCTWVYAKHTRAERRELWDALRNIDDGEEPWLLGGDFNTVLYCSERKGGAAPKIRTMEDFGDMMMDCGLQDAGFEGSKFTWSRSRLWQRLDRFLFSHTWTQAFPLSRIQHLTRNVSDHCPLLLSVKQEKKTGPTPFRFQNMWTKHHDFKHCVTTSWQHPIHGHGMFAFQQKLHRIKAALKLWNTEVFGNIFQNITDAEQRVKIAEQAYDGDPSDENLIAMNKATAELTFALSVEESYWKQKAACKWLEEGEKNTKYFHSLTKKKRKQSRIYKIQHNGATLTKAEDIKVSVVDYFTQAFTRDDTVSVDNLHWVPNILSEEDRHQLNATPTIEDVKTIIFDMCPHSTAGPDGFSAHFFQCCWEIIGQDLYGAVLDFLSGSTPPKNFTTTTIVLIPKIEAPSTWKDFRPISLCNVTGKILSKVINNQMAKLLPKIISPSQSSFVQGRMISDNILLAQELSHCLGKNGSLSNTIFKIDMEKAYDRVNWTFLYHMLMRVGFPTHWINMIKKLIENCWFSILINGEGVGFFKSTRGLRQGDPLSPTLFVIAAECLSRGLDWLFQQQPRMNFFARSSKNISHLAFADDIIIFSKGTRKDLKTLMEFLRHYELISGQRINKEKSSFTVDKKTSNMRIRCIQQVTGFRLKYLPITYLGAPLFKGNKKGALFDELIQKIRNKITGWEKALLSHGGRLQLIKSVLSAMPTYLLQVLKPPKYVMERIERLFNKFLWGNTGEQRKLNWSSWDDICYPTEEGGFGVRRIQDVVHAFQLKLWWRFRNQSSLWALFLLEKYYTGSHPVPAKLSYIASPNWKRMCRHRKEADKQIFWSLGKGHISFWFDNWIGEKPLFEIMPDFEWNTTPVNNYWENNSWNVAKLREVLTADMVHQICQIPFDVDTSDTPLWKLSGDGIFSMKATWNSLRQTRATQQLVKEIWSPFVTPTMSVFMWRLINDKLPVDEKLQKKGIQLASKCSCCNHVESLQHVFIEGNGIRCVWEHFARKFNMNLPNTDNIVLLLNYWRISALGQNHIRMIVPMLILWFGWLERNDVKHRNKNFNSDRIKWKVHQHIVTTFKSKTTKRINWKGDRFVAKFMGLELGSQYKPKIKIVKWTKPELGWIKINTDGASKGNPGRAGAGGIARMRREQSF